MKKKKAQKGINIKTDVLGYWDPENWGKPVNIPSNKITMKGVSQPLVGISNTGDTQMMLPNNEYKFNGENVVEFPISKDMKTKSKKGKIKKAQLGSEIMNKIISPKTPDPSTVFDEPVPIGQPSFNLPQGTYGPGTSITPTNQTLVPIQQSERKSQSAAETSPWAGKGGYNTWKGSDTNFADNSNYPLNPNLKTQPQPKKDGLSDALGAIPIAGGLIQGIMAIGDQNKAIKREKATTQLAALNAKAAGTTPKEEMRKYVRPEDTIVSGDELYPVNGVGTDILARDGKKVPKAFLGSLMSALGVGGSSPITPQGQEAGQMIGSSVGKAADLIMPGLGSIASPILGAIGGIIDTSGEQLAAEKKKQTASAMEAAGIDYAKGFQNQHRAFMQDGGKMAYGGDLTVDNGSIQPISENPYSSGTMEFKGPSHDDGGILANYGGNPVEVEGGETGYVEKMTPIGMSPTHQEIGRNKILQQFGEPQEQLTIFGNLPITKESAAIIGDKRAAGKKFKTFGKMIANDERKANNIQKRSLDKLDETDERTTFGKLTMNSLLANDIGTKMKLKEAAVKKEKAGMLQEFFNTTSEEQGLSAEHLAKGQIKQAKKGANIKKAQWGEGLPIETYAQFLSEATIKPQPSAVQKLMMEEGIKAMMRGEKPLFPISTNSGNVSGDAAKNRERLIAQNRERLSPASVQSSSPQQTSAPQSSGVSRQPSSGNSSYTSQYGLPYGRGEYSAYQQMIDRKAEDQFSVPKQTKSNSKSPLYGGVSFKDIADNWPKEVLQDAKLDVSKPDSWTAADIQRLQSVVKTKYPQMYSQLEDKLSNTTDLFGVDWYSLGLQKSKTPDPEPEETPKLVPDVVTNKTNEKETPKETPVEQEKAKNKVPWQLIGDVVSPFMKRKYREGLDWRQLVGEMAAMRDHEEPVYAQQFSPELDTPYDISFQDRLNENTATTRALSRGMGYNPAAMSTLASQKYAADSNVLAEQFRANQAKKDQVYSKNRDILNSAKLTNLGILDKQQERQALAKSNTKANRQAALSSMASKYLQNEFENKQLGVLENLYPNFGFDRNMNALNQGFSFFGAPTIGSIPVEEDSKKGADKARKGRIVKAIKHL